MIINKNEQCTKCGNEVNVTFGYRYCDICSFNFYACCKEHSFCPHCGKKIIPLHEKMNILY